MRRPLRPLCSLSLPLCLSLAALSACDPPAEPGAVVLHHGSPSEVHPAAVDDLAADLGRILSATVRRAPLASDAFSPTSCRPGEIHVFLYGTASPTRERSPSTLPALTPQQYTITEERCANDGHRIALRGGGVLSSQWAAYDLLQRLGVRYFHPERTLYPPRAAWPSEPINARETPFFAQRDLQAHRTHPIELSAPLDATGIDMAGYQRRWIDWNIKNRFNGINGYDLEYVGNYPYERGLPRTGGFTLEGSQQGQNAALDPDDPRPENEQIVAAIDRTLAPVAGQPDVTWMGIQFNSSEFTETDDRLTVQRLTLIADQVRERYPNVSLYTINHGTHGEPTPNYRVRFFDLPQFAPPSLGVQVHPLMFYDLERPAPVYGNANFAHLLTWIRAQAPTRRVVHYPEGSWWLTFDLPVPLYLAPATLEARQHDIDLLSDLISGDDTATHGVVGHKLFTSGQEWGYWLIDYCFGGMSWSRAYTHERCLRDFTGSLAQGDALYAVLREAEARQVTDLRDPELLRFLVGTDEATETAARAGVVFHPLPPSLTSVLEYTDAQVTSLRTRSLTPLAAMATAYAAWADRVEALLPAQSEAQAPWVREVRDGLRIFGLRAEHSVALYEAALALRAALAAEDRTMLAAAMGRSAMVRAVTERARAVVMAREADYRYPPALSTAGDEVGTPGAVPNRSVYPYRVLSRTHRLFYWTQPDDQLDTLLRTNARSVRVNARMVTESEALRVSFFADTVRDPRVRWGDGTEASTNPAEHRYARQGLFDWSLDASFAGGTEHYEDRVASVAARYVFAKGSLHVTEPMGASVLDGILPGFEVGTGEDTMGAFLALGRIDGANPPSARGSLVRRPRTGETSPALDLTLDVPGVGQLTVFASEITVQPAGGMMGAPRMTIRGQASTQQIIERLVAVGGFREDGARRIVASVLGYTPMTLPARVPFVIAGDGRR